MLLAIDVGNTNTVFAIFEGNTITGQWRMGSDPHRTADEYAHWLLGLMERTGQQPKSVNAAIMGSVVPQANFELRRLCRNYFHTDLLVVGEGSVSAGIKINIDRPAEVGADRVVNAVAAWNQCKAALIVVDFGTATTFDVVDDKGCYQGGIIAPGIHLSLEALEHAAAKLPDVDIARPSRVIGKDTVTAMQSGIYYGYAGLIEGIIARIREEQGLPMKVVATGGLAPFFATATKVFDFLEPDLTLRGLYEIYQLNR